MDSTGGKRRLALTTIVAGILLVAAACSGGSGDTTTLPPPSSSTAPSTTTATAPVTTVAQTTTIPPVDPPTVGPLVIGSLSEPSSLDAQTVNDRASRLVTSNVFETLLTRDATGALVPGLATSVTALDDTTWEVELRQGVLFSDGSEFDAETAAFSINRMLVDGFVTTRRAFLGRLVEASDTAPLTIRITTDGVDALMPLKLANIPMVPLSADTNPNFATIPVGTGPYQVVSWEPGVAISLQSFAGHWGGAPSITAFTVQFFAEEDALLAALEAGEVDLVPDITAEQALLAPAAVTVLSTDFSYVQLNTLADDLSDPNVRVALNHAIDKEALAASVYGGNAVPSAAQNVSASMLGFNADLAPFAYDPELARTMLQDAGAEDLAVTLYVPIRRFPGGQESAEFVKTQLEAVGVTVEIMEIRWPDFREAVGVKGDQEGAYDAAYTWSSNEWLDSHRLFSQVTCDGAASKYCDNVVERQFRDALKTTDQAARAAAYQTAWAQIHENPHGIFLLQQPVFHGTSSSLQWAPRIDDEYLVATMSLAG